MKYLDFYQHFSSNWRSLVFSINDIKNVFPDFNNVQLNQWQKKGYVKKIRKEQYVFTKRLNDLRLLSHDLKKSYISMENALSYYEWIPESVFNITAVTTTRGEEVKIDFGTIIYRQIKPSLFIGYELKPSNVYPERFFSIALPEKALFDLVYFRHDLVDEKDFNSLRLSIDSFRIKKFKSFIDLVEHPGRKNRVLSLLRFVKKKFL
jgi:hypothetical protein